MRLSGGECHTHDTPLGLDGHDTPLRRRTPLLWSAPVAVLHQTAHHVVATHQTWATHVVTPTHHGTLHVATTSQLAAVPRIEHVLPTVRLWTATQYDWSLMRGLLASRTFGEMGYVLPGLSSSEATATASDACRGDRDVRGTITRRMNQCKFSMAFELIHSNWSGQKDGVKSIYGQKEGRLITMIKISPLICMQYAQFRAGHFLSFVSNCLYYC